MRVVNVFCCLRHTPHEVKTRRDAAVTSDAADGLNITWLEHSREQQKKNAALQKAQSVPQLPDYTQEARLFETPSLIFQRTSAQRKNSCKIV